MRNSNEISAALKAKMAETATDAEARTALAVEIEALTSELREAQVNEAAERALASQKVLSDPEKKELKRFSISKMIREAADGNITGFEAEMEAEGKREMDAAHINGVGNVHIPSAVLRNSYQNSSDTNYGPEFNQVTMMSYAEALKNNLVMAKAGATYIDGLQGRVQIVRGGGATASWIAEEAAASVDRQTYSSVVMYPKRLQILAGYTLDLLKQSSLSVDEMIMREMLNEHAAALDAAIINGSGSSGQPTGILYSSFSNVNTVAIDTNGGPITWAKLVEMEQAVAEDNSLRGSLAYITNPKVCAKMKTIARESGYPYYLLEDGKCNGYDVLVSNAVPSNLTKGTTSGTCSAAIFGNFNDVIVGNWGGLEFLVDPFSKKANGVIEISAFAYHDVTLRHEQSFAKIVDITTA